MSTSFKPQFDTLSHAMLGLAFLLAFFSLSFQPAASEQFFLVFYLLMGFGGIALGVLFAAGKIRSDTSLSGLELRNMFLYIVLSTAMVYFMATAAYYVPAETQHFNFSMFENLIIGVSEELFFTFFLFAWLVNKLGLFPALLASSVVFAIFHTAALGLTMGPLLIVFAARFVMNYAFFISGGRIAVPMGAHILYNTLVMGI